MLKVGLTGGIGSGKSTVAGIFQLLGVPVYIADLRAHMLMLSNADVRSQITALLGPGSYDAEGRPDRRYIASKVFVDPQLLDKLNAIIHPAVGHDFIAWCSEFSSMPYVIHEAAILFESGVSNLMDENILIWAPEDLRIERVMKRDKVQREDVMARVQHQWSDAQKVPLAQFVIINDDTHSLIRQVMEIDATLRHIVGSV